MKTFFSTKKKLFVSLIISVFALVLFTACAADESSIGIIGGADGPTAIIVSTPSGTEVSNGGDSFIARLFARGVLQYFDGSAAYVAVMVAMYVLSALIAYALGSLNFGIVISKLIYRDDIRKYGSGNAGTTNMLRTFGKGAAIGTILGDALKVVLSIIISYLLVGSIMGGGYIAGLFAIIGHVYPIYYGFKGGKGVVAAAITILMLDPSIFAVILTVFVVVVAIWRYISLGSIICASIYPLITYAAYGASPKTLFAFLIAVFVIYLHKTNIQRLLEGKENKLSFKKTDKKSAEEKNSEEK